LHFAFIVESLKKEYDSNFHKIKYKFRCSKAITFQRNHSYNSQWIYVAVRELFASEKRLRLCYMLYYIKTFFNLSLKGLNTCWPLTEFTPPPFHRGVKLQQEVLIIDILIFNVVRPPQWPHFASSF
jgi:hypothetical protein